MAAVKNSLKSLLVTTVLTVCFLMAVFYFLTSYDRYQKVSQTHDLLSAKVNALFKNKRDADRNKSVHADINNFIEKAYALGLEKKRWATLEVDLDTKVSFAEMAQLIDQCANTSAYYFRPGKLHLQSDAKPAEAAQHKSLPRKAGRIQDTPTQSESIAEMQLALKGAFIVGPTND